jgi:hypothetical protein
MTAETSKGTQNHAVKDLVLSGTKQSPTQTIVELQRLAPQVGPEEHWLHAGASPLLRKNQHKRFGQFVNQKSSNLTTTNQ